MKKRNPIAVFLLPFITLGIYSLYWAVKTKGEMNRLGEHIPTAWILIIPIVGPIWWYWLYSKGVDHVTEGKMNNVVAFLLLYLLGFIGEAIIQDSFNDVGATAIASSPQASPNQSVPMAPIAPSPQPSVASSPAQNPASPTTPPSPPTVTPPTNPPLVSG